MNEPRPQVVEYQQPTGRTAPTGGEVLFGGFMFAAAVVFGLAAVLAIVVSFSEEFREGVGQTLAFVVGVVFGLVAAFCGRFSYELFQHRK